MRSYFRTNRINNKNNPDQKKLVWITDQLGFFFFFKKIICNNLNNSFHGTFFPDTLNECLEVFDELLLMFCWDLRPSSPFAAAPFSSSFGPARPIHPSLPSVSGSASADVSPPPGVVSSVSFLIFDPVVLLWETRKQVLAGKVLDRCCKKR